jgi:hypothetical protein
VSVGRVAHLALAVPIALEQHGVIAVLIAYAPDFTDYDGRSLVPGDPLELALPAVLRVPFTVRIPVNTL